MVENAMVLTGELAGADAGTAAARSEKRSKAARALVRGALRLDGDNVRVFLSVTSDASLKSFVENFGNFMGKFLLVTGAD
jgi:hypothetical protein